jgi:hypothetical protein
MFFLPMQLLIGSWTAFWVTLIIFIITQITLYFTWYKQLPPPRDGVENPGIVGAIIHGHDYEAGIAKPVKLED